MPAPRYSEVARVGVREAARASGRNERGATNAAQTPSGRDAKGAAQALAQTPAQPTGGHDARFVFPFALAVNRKVVVQVGTHTFTTRVGALSHLVVQIKPSSTENITRPSGGLSTSVHGKK